eukprot:7197257-Alexandrium_andersonii.AAC.1
MFSSSTFEHCASGLSSHAWFAPNGNPCGLDYLALPIEARAVPVRLKDPGDFDVSASGLDRVSVSPSVQLDPSSAPPVTGARGPFATSKPWPGPRPLKPLRGTSKSSHPYRGLPKSCLLYTSPSPRD